MGELITITVPLEQAEALVDATNCLSLAAEGKLDILNEAYAPENSPDSGPADAWRLRQAELASEAAHMMRPQIDDAYKRNPDVQEFLHRMKMHRKHGRPA
jgi:hypothetical protein